jgi:hypothetical protein
LNFCLFHTIGSSWSQLSSLMSTRSLKLLLPSRRGKNSRYVYSQILESETQFKLAIVCSTAASPVHLLLRRVGRQSVSSGEIGDGRRRGPNRATGTDGVILVSSNFEEMFTRVSHISCSAEMIYRSDRGSKAVSLGSCFYGLRSYVQKRIRESSACSASYQVSN